MLARVGCSLLSVGSWRSAERSTTGAEKPDREGNRVKLVETPGQHGGVPVIRAWRAGPVHGKERGTSCLPEHRMGTWMGLANERARHPSHVEAARLPGALSGGGGAVVPELPTKTSRRWHAAKARRRATGRAASRLAVQRPAADMQRGTVGSQRGTVGSPPSTDRLIPPPHDHSSGSNSGQRRFRIGGFEPMAAATDFGRFGAIKARAT